MGCAGPQKKHFEWTHRAYEKGEATKAEIDRLAPKANAECQNKARAHVEGSSQSYDMPDEGPGADFGFGYMLGRMLTSGRREHEAKQQYYVDCMRSKGFILLSVTPLD